MSDENIKCNPVCFIGQWMETSHVETLSGRMLTLQVSLISQNSVVRSWTGIVCKAKHDASKQSDRWELVWCHYIDSPIKLISLPHLFIYLLSISLLTYWGRVMHICVGNLTIIASDNGLSPNRRQAITWTNSGILLIGSLGTNFSELCNFVTEDDVRILLCCNWRYQ